MPSGVEYESFVLVLNTILQVVRVQILESGFLWY